MTRRRLERVSEGARRSDTEKEIYEEPTRRQDRVYMSIQYI